MVFNLTAAVGPVDPNDMLAHTAVLFPSTCKGSEKRGSHSIGSLSRPRNPQIGW